MNRRVLIVALLSAGLVAGAAGTGPVKTGKERLSDKASDEQRVNDCKVPPERRGASHRPTECGRRSQPAEPPPDCGRGQSRSDQCKVERRRGATLPRPDSPPKGGNAQIGRN